jgi:hypothetical protein
LNITYEYEPTPDTLLDTTWWYDNNGSGAIDSCDFVKLHWLNPQDSTQWVHIIKRHVIGIERIVDNGDGIWSPSDSVYKHFMPLFDPLRPFTWRYHVRQVGEWFLDDTTRFYIVEQTYDPHTVIVCETTIVCDTTIIWSCLPGWGDFNGQNAGPFPNTGTYNPAYPVNVEVEQAIDVSQGSRFQVGEVDGSEVYALENNHGGVEGFGAVFGTLWKSGLYYGSLVLGDDQADLNCDYGNYYPGSTFAPEGPPKVDNFTVAGTAGNYDFMVLSNQFEQSFMTGIDVTNYAFGFTVPATADQCPEFGILEVVNIFNNTDNPVTVRVAKWKDWDVSSGGTGDVADFNQPYQSMWMYPDAAPDTVFGETEVPHVVGDVPMTGYVLSQAARVYDGQYVDSLYYWLGALGWGQDEAGTPEDRSFFIAEEITIPAHSMAVKQFIEWAHNGAIGAGGDANWKTYLYCMLHFLGYYRGDVDANGKYNVADVIYMINYLFKSGPKPIEFTDQMDVDNNHNPNVADVIYTINYLFKGGPPAIDENRPIWYWSNAGAEHKALAKRVPGLFGDANWKALHP